MFVYIFQSIGNLTDSYHSGGGLVVIASGLQQAIDAARARDVSFSPDEIADVKIHELVDENTPAAVYIFPDAGCC